jgi:hypothetical protein
MSSLSSTYLQSCDFGDQRLTNRGVLIGEVVAQKYGKPLSQIFGTGSDLKRAYEFFSNPKTSYEKVSHPYRQKTAELAHQLPIILSVGDTTYLDYKKIIAKREEYGPIGKGGNGLILHSSLAINPENGQPIGLLWEKLWSREQGKKKPKIRPFAEKESYRWVEAFDEVEQLFSKAEEKSPTSPRIIHIFDREGDIAEVFEKANERDNTGLVVRAAHNRAISQTDTYLWEEVTSKPVQLMMEIELPKTHKRVSRQAQLGIRYCPIKLRSPNRCKKQESFPVYAVYAREIDPPDGEKPVEWMLLTTEDVKNATQAQTILRWYTYRWRVEEYHKILKSGCKAESYRLGGSSMEVLLGFLTNIAAQLLSLTYLNRTEPETPAISVLSETQLSVLVANCPSYVPSVLTVAWATKEIARLGGYLDHRKHSPIGITVLWRGWSELQQLCLGWTLHARHSRTT